MARAIRATPLELDAAVQALRGGEVVAFPTETVYGLGANAQHAAAVQKIFTLKGRPAAHPLIVHLDSARFLHRWAREVPAAAARLAERFWPGPLTLVLPRAVNVLDLVTGGQDSVAREGACPSDGAAAPAGLRRRDRRAFRESLRARQPDARRARARGIRRCRAGSARRWRMSGRS